MIWAFLTSLVRFAAMFIRLCLRCCCSTPVKKRAFRKTKGVVAQEGYVYLLQEREFLGSSVPVLKLGRTTCFDPRSRLKSYPKGSQIQYICQVSDVAKAEHQLLSAFRSRFASRRDIGCEYFEGPPVAMRKLFLQQVVAMQ